MNRIAFIFGGGVIAAASFVGVSFAHEGEHKEAEAETTTVIGELIDTACFTASDGDAKGEDHAECATKCLGSGIPAGILPEGKGEDDALVMLTNPKPFAPFAAQTIKVEGIVNDERHVIDVKKAYVKDGENWKEIQLDDEHHKKSGGDEKKMDDMKGMDDAHKDHKN